MLWSFVGDERMKPCFDTLDFEKTIYCLVSGGRDSTAMVLDLWDFCHFHQIEPDIRLLFGDTRLNLAKSRKTLERLEQKTGFPLVVVEYEGDKKPIEILHESFEKIPKAIELKDHEGATYKKVFPCCDLLKKRPMKEYFKTLDPNDIILVLGIKQGDKALHRKYRLNQLRDADTYYRKHKNNGLLYYYPLRDCDNTDIESVLRRHDFEDVESSGCSICPIFCVADWKKKDPDTHRRSVAMAQRLGIDPRAENQLPLSIFCGEIK